MMTLFLPCKINVGFNTFLSKGIYLLLFLFCSNLIISAQVTVTTFPKNLQLYPRNLITNNGGVNFVGTVNSNTNYTELRLKKYRDNVFQAPFTTIPLSFTGSIAAFNISDSIPAELFNYKYELYGFKISDGSETHIQTALDVVAGDVYIIQGQSNAEAAQVGANDANVTEQNNFIRVYCSGNEFGCSNLWYVGDGNVDHNNDGNTGQWGLRMANLIRQTYNIPVCILNGADPGREISFFQRNDVTPLDLTTNYGRLLYRTQAAAVQNKIRGIFWFQGEQNALTATTIASYKLQFYELYNDWKTDYSSVTKFYIFQTRYGCWPTAEAALQIQQAHKELADETADIEIISTNNATQVSEAGIGFCHFGFIDGYKLLGERAFYLLQRDMYQTTGILDIESPYPVVATLSSATQVSISLKNTTDTYTADAASISDFTLLGPGTYNITGISISSNNILLDFTKTGPAPTGISFSAHSGAAAPSVYNAKGNGLISFYNKAIVPALPVREITLSAMVSANDVELNWQVNDNENIKSFTLERGDKPTNFLAINTSDVHLSTRYIYKDANPLPGTNYYRVRADKATGNYLYSPVIAVNVGKIQKAALIVYPNPFIDNLNIIYTTPINEKGVVKIFSTDWKLISQTQLNFGKGQNYIPFKVPLSLGKGLYFMQCITESGVYNQKIIK